VDRDANARSRVLQNPPAAFQSAVLGIVNACTDDEGHPKEVSPAADVDRRSYRSRQDYAHTPSACIQALPGTRALAVSTKLRASLAPRNKRATVNALVENRLRFPPQRGLRGLRGIRILELTIVTIGRTPCFHVPCTCSFSRSLPHSASPQTTKIEKRLSDASTSSSVESTSSKRLRQRPLLNPPQQYNRLRTASYDSL